ncbi:MAG: hypothetical protein U0935_07390 [Pirellulales bacterium]
MTLRYVAELAELRQAFPRPDPQDADDAAVAEALADVVRRALALKSSAPQLAGTARGGAAAATARLPDHPAPLEHVFAELLACLAGLPLEIHPYNQVNVNAQPSTAGLAGVLLPALFNPNLSSNGRGAGCSDAERRVTAMVARLVGYDPHEAAGLFTFGGTGTMLYGVKLGLETAVPGALLRGIDRPVVVLASEHAHHTCLTAAGWLGIGQERVWRLPAGPDHAVQLEVFRDRARQAVRQGYRIAALVATVGTTDAFGLDDVAGIVELRDELVRSESLDYVPHVHADAVIGWAWTVFGEYPWEENPLEFPADTCEALAATAGRVAALAHADSLGVDFHKTGFVPYVSSLFMVRQQEQFTRLLRDPSTMPYLFHAGNYHPGMYSLETTRSASGVLAALASLELCGRRGLQVLLGHAVTRTQEFRRRLASLPWLQIVNARNGGPVTLYRAYPPGSIPAVAWERECTDASSGSWSLEVNDLNRQLHQATQAAARSGTAAGAGWTERVRHGAAGQPLAALKTYLLSPFLTEQHLESLVGNLRQAYARWQQNRSVS